jgi:hypothetical protein
MGKDMQEGNLSERIRLLLFRLVVVLMNINDLMSHTYIL